MWYEYLEKVTSMSNKVEKKNTQNKMIMKKKNRNQKGIKPLSGALVVQYAANEPKQQ